MAVKYPPAFSPSEALDTLKDISKFATKIGERRSFVVELSATPVTIPLGDHSHLMVENTGAADLNLVQSNQVVPWIPALGGKVLDGDTELFITLSGPTTVRITVWGSAKDIKRMEA